MRSVAAWVFGIVLILVAVANTPPVAERLNTLIGKSADTNLEATDTAASAADEQPAVEPLPQAAEQPSEAEAATEVAAAPTETATPEPQPETSVEASGTPPEGAAQQAAEEPAAPAAETEEATEVASLPEEETEAAGEAAVVAIPTFGLLRVEPDGSTVIAGQAGPDAEIQILAGADMIASTRAASNGDFVAILDTPLAPGDYEIVLRATGPDGASAMSEETAIVSVPEEGREGELLALVEQPGVPSRLINTPEPGEAQEVAQDDAQEPVAEAATAPQVEDAAEASETVAAPEADAVVAEEKPAEMAAEQPADEVQSAPAGTAQTDEAASEPDTQGETEIAALPAEESQSAVEDDATPGGEVRIEAVEIDGETVFVAGAAPAGAQLRVYANDILLGDTNASPGGRFLVQVARDLPVGDYIMRADLIDPATADVVMRAVVPFTRSAGERVAAVAVEAPTAAEAEAPTETTPAEASADGEDTVSDRQTVEEAAAPDTPAATEEVAATSGETAPPVAVDSAGESETVAASETANGQEVAAVEPEAKPRTGNRSGSRARQRAGRTGRTRAGGTASK